MKIPSIRKSSFKNLSYYLISSIMATLIGLVINPFLSIGLSHTDFAIIGYYASLGSFLAPIMSFSFGSYYARNYFLLEEEDRVKLLNTILSLFLVFGFVVLFIFYFGYYYYHINSVSSIPFKPYAFLSFLPIYFSSFYNIYLLNLRLQNKARKYAIITILNAVLGALISMLLVYVLTYGAEGRLIAILVVAVIFGIYSLKTEKFIFDLDWIIAKKAFIFSTPLALSAVLTFFFMGIDRTFLIHLNDNRSLGLYNVGLQISGYVGIFGTVFLQTFEPDLYKYASLKETKKLMNLLIVITVVTLLPNLVFMILSKPLINVLTFGKYIEASGYANVLCIRNVATSLSFSLSSVLVGYGFAKYELFNKLIGSFLAILLYKILIEKYGFYGAAWGQSFSWILMATISIIFLFFMNNKIKAKL